MELFRPFLESVLMPGAFLLALMFGDFVFGVIVALVQKRFKWELLPQFLISDGAWVLVWFFSEGLLYFFNDLFPQVVASAIGAGLYLPVAGKIGASLIGHFSALGLLTDKLNKLAIKPTGAVEDREDAVG